MRARRRVRIGLAAVADPGRLRRASRRRRRSRPARPRRRPRSPRRPPSRTPTLATVTVSGAVDGRVRLRAVRRRGADRDGELRRARALRLLRRHLVPPRSSPASSSRPATRRTKTTTRRLRGHGHGRARLRVRDRAAGGRARLRSSTRSRWRTTRRRTAASSSSPSSTSTGRAGSAATRSSARSCRGTDVVDAIAAVPVNDPAVGVPLELVTIESIVISGAIRAAAVGRLTRQAVPKTALQCKGI